MVEGAFMALIMCLIWNLMVYCAGLYLSKLESVYVVKYNTFWYSAHDCKGTPPDYKTPIFSPQTQIGPPQQADKDQQDCKDSGGNSGTPQCTQVAPSGFGKSGFFANAQTKTKFTWSWQRPAWWSTAMSGTGTGIHSEAFVMCNEGPYGVNVFSFLKDFASQIVGAVTGS